MSPITYGTTDSFACMRWNIGSLALAIVGAAGCGTPFSEAEEKAAMEKGAALAKASFKALSTRLRQAMNEGGPAHAVDFCSLNALSLMDSLSTTHHAHIRRTSDRVRDTHDQPDAEEARIMKDMLAEWEAGGGSPNIPARGMAHGDSIAYYAPIFISSPACLKCHGDPGSSMDASALSMIDERYPDDRAKGYELGDLRGMWSIRWAR